MELNVGEILVNSYISAIKSLLFQFWPIMVIFVVLNLTYLLYKQYCYRKSDIFSVDTMSGQDFEMFLVNLFQRLGYKTDHIGKLGDYGGDLIIEKEGVKTVVQAKRSKYKIREKAIQEAIAAKENYHCNKAMVVSNNYYYYHAWKLAQNTNVTLWTRKDLIRNIEIAYKRSEK